MKQVYFDGWLVGNTRERIIASFEDIYSSPEVELSLSEIAESDGSLVFDSRERSKILRLKGHLLTPNLSGFLGVVDELKENLSKRGKKLRVVRGDDSEREWIASLQGAVRIAQESYSSTYAQFEADFLCEDPFSYDPFWTTWSGVTITGLYASTILAISGTKEPLPEINYYAVNSGNLTGITFVNKSTEDRIFIDLLPVEFGNGDILTIDCYSKKVFINDTFETAFSGMFPSFPLGLNTLETYFAAATTIEDQKQVETELRYVIGGSWYKFAQSFRPSVSWNLYRVSLLLGRDGDPGTVTVEIQTDNSNEPSGTVLGSATIMGTSLPENGKWVDISFPSPISLTADTSYWIVVYPQNQAGTLVWIGLTYDNYSRGKLLIYRYTGTWEWYSPYGIEREFCFRTHMVTANPTYTINWEVKYKRRWR